MVLMLKLKYSRISNETIEHILYGVKSIRLDEKTLCVKNAKGLHRYNLSDIEEIEIRMARNPISFS